MISHRPTQHFIRSTSNTRIERLWVESGRHFVRLWHAFFTHLERNNRLNRKDPEHIWLLQVLFMGEIQQDCDEFVRDWNSHPLSGRGHYQSPLVRLAPLSLLIQCAYWPEGYALTWTA